MRNSGRGRCSLCERQPGRVVPPDKKRGPSASSRPSSRTTSAAAQGRLNRPLSRIIQRHDAHGARRRRRSHARHAARPRRDVRSAAHAQIRPPARGFRFSDDTVTLDMPATAPRRSLCHSCQNTAAGSRVSDQKALSLYAGGLTVPDADRLAHKLPPAPVPECALRDGRPLRPSALPEFGTCAVRQRAVRLCGVRLLRRSATAVFGDCGVRRLRRSATALLWPCAVAVARSVDGV